MNRYTEWEEEINKLMEPKFQLRVIDFIEDVIFDWEGEFEKGSDPVTAFRNWEYATQNDLKGRLFWALQDDVVDDDYFEVMFEHEWQDIVARKDEFNEIRLLVNNAYASGSG